MKRSTSPRVTVVIPVYQARYLAECLASVFRQTRRPARVVVVDDGCPDQDALRQALAPYARIDLLRQENRGAGAARNVGVRATDTELIAFLDADDVWEPQFLEAQVPLLHADVDAVYSNARLIGEGPLRGRLFMDTAPSEGPVDLEALLAQRCTVLTSSVVVRRKALLDAGLFDEDLRRGQDYDMWIRLAAAGARFSYTRDVLVQRRIHSSNLSGDRLTELERASAVLVRLGAKVRLTSQQRRVLEGRVHALRAQISLENGKRELATGNLLEAVQHFHDASRIGAGWKCRLVHLALQVAPTLTRTVYRLRERRSPPTRQATAS